MIEYIIKKRIFVYGKKVFRIHSRVKVDENTPLSLATKLAHESKWGFAVVIEKPLKERVKENKKTAEDKKKEEADKKKNDIKSLKEQLKTLEKNKERCEKEIDAFKKATDKKKTPKITEEEFKKYISEHGYFVESVLKMDTQIRELEEK